MQPDAIYTKLVRAGVRLETHGETFRAYYREDVLPDELRVLIRSHKAELLPLVRKGCAPARLADPNTPQDLCEKGGKAPSLQDEYAPLFLELWGNDVIGPLACWIWFEVPHVPMNVWIAPALYADLDLYRWIKEGLDTGPSFLEKDRLREVLMTLYEFIEG